MVRVVSVRSKRQRLQFSYQTCSITLVLTTAQRIILEQVLSWNACNRLAGMQCIAVHPCTHNYQHPGSRQPGEDVGTSLSVGVELCTTADSCAQSPLRYRSDLPNIILWKLTLTVFFECESVTSPVTSTSK